MGGGTTINQPTPPAPPTTGESIQEYIKYAPELFDLQQKQAPQEAQQQLDMLQQFGSPMGRAMQEAQSAINPQTSAMQEEMAGIARKGYSEGMSQDEKDQYLSDFRGNLGTNAGSPIGAFATSRGMNLANQAKKDLYMNMGLSLAGRQPLTNAQQPNTTNFAGSLTPGQVLGFNQGNFGSQANIFGSQAGMYNQQGANQTAQRGQNLNFASQFIPSMSFGFGG